MIDPTAQMDSPELLLPELNRALRSLRGALDVLEKNEEESEKLGKELLPIMQSLLLAEILGSKAVVAVAGSQGAGKSTLLRGMYDLNDKHEPWLITNEGRGEKLPVLIEEEAGYSRARGFVRELAKGGDGSYELSLREVDPQQFQAACSGDDPKCLLPVLKVPPRFFHRPNTAWILLPGYERQDRTNRNWQELMRQGFIGSSFFVLVTDGTRLASAADAQIVKDMASGLLRDAKPIVVVSKTEGSAQEKLAGLRRSAAAVFGLSPAEADRQVVCTGSSDNESYKATWMPALTHLLQNMSAGGAGHRRNQVSQLEGMLRQDLVRAMASIRRHADIFLQAGQATDAGQQATFNDCLQAFDDARDQLRESYQKALKGMLGSHAGAAWNALQQTLADEHEGLYNKARNLFNTASQDQLELEGSVEQAWAQPGAIIDTFVEQMQGVTSAVLRGPGPVVPAQQAAPCHAGAMEGQLRRLGYVDDAGLPLPWAEPSEAAQQDLRRIFGQDQSDTSKQLSRAISLLPALTLEYTRSASLLLPCAGAHPEQLKDLPAADVEAAVGKLKEGFEEAQGFSKTVLAGLLAFLATDVAGDGKVNLFGLLDGPGAAGGALAMHPVGAAIVATLSLANLARVASKEVRQHDCAVRVHAHGMVLGIKESHYAHFLSHFDELMNRMRECLKGRLRQRYGLDMKLMEQDRLAKALADVRAARRGLLDELVQGGPALQPLEFAPA